MIFVCHAVYTILLILYHRYFSECSISIEDFKQLNRRKQIKYRLGPFFTIVLIYLFPVMNYFLTQANLATVHQGFLHQFINATAFNVFYLLRRLKEKTKVGWPFWVAFLAYLIYTIVKNFTLHDAFLTILLAQAMSIAFAGIIAFVACMIADEYRILSLKEVAERDREMEETHRIAEEYSAKLDEEKRLRELEERTPEAMERKRQEYLEKERQYQAWRESAERREAERKAQAANTERKPVYVIEACSNCKHYFRGRCTKLSSPASSLSRIANPAVVSCVWYEEA